MTVYFPPDKAGTHRAPAVVMVHGGGWISGSRTLLSEQARQIAEAGFVVFNIDYDLSAPRYPRQVNDVVSAIDYVRTQAAHFKIDPSRIGGVGTSAGANLLMDAVTTGHAQLKAAVGWSGPYDLTAHDTPKDQALALGSAAIYLGCVPVAPECVTRAVDASPIHHVTPDGPPTLLFNSANELIALDQMIDFADRLRGAGTTVDTRAVPGTGHAIAYTDEAIEPTVSFLQQHLS